MREGLKRQAGAASSPSLRPRRSALVTAAAPLLRERGFGHIVNFGRGRDLAHCAA